LTLSYNHAISSVYCGQDFGYIITEVFFSGIDDNDTMKVFGKGGADVERNKPGDLYVTIKV
jgi:hypothetical protein